MGNSVGIGDGAGNVVGNSVGIGDRGSDMVGNGVGVGHWGSNSLGVGDRSSNGVSVGNRGSSNMVGNSVGSISDRGNNIVSVGGNSRAGNMGETSSIVDKSWVSLGFSLTLDNMLNTVVLGDVRGTNSPVGDSGVVDRALVAGHGMAGSNSIVHNGLDSGSVVNNRTDGSIDGSVVNNRTDSSIDGSVVNNRLNSSGVVDNRLDSSGIVDNRVDSSSVVDNGVNGSRSLVHYRVDSVLVDSRVEGGSVVHHGVVCSTIGGVGVAGRVYQGRVGFRLTSNEGGKGENYELKKKFRLIFLLKH